MAGTNPPTRPTSVVAAAVVLFIAAGLYGIAGALLFMLTAALSGTIAGRHVLYLAVAATSLMLGLRLLAGKSWARDATNFLAVVLLVPIGLTLIGGGYSSLLFGVPGLGMQVAVLILVNGRAAREHLTD